MPSFTMCSLPQTVVASAATLRSTEPCSQILRAIVNSLSFSGKVSTKPTLHSLRCHATQTQSAQRKSTTATIQRSGPKGPKLDDGSGGFPPFRFGKGGEGGGGGGGGSNYFSGFLLFACVLFMDYFKEFEKTCFCKGNS